MEDLQLNFETESSVDAGRAAILAANLRCRPRGALEQACSRGIDRLAQPDQAKVEIRPLPRKRAALFARRLAT